MATISDARSVQATLSTTTVDIVNITQFYDGIQITNHDATTPLTITWDDSTPSTGTEGQTVVPVSSSLTYRDSFIRNQAGVPGSTTAATVCHRIKILGNGNLYSVEGVAGQ